MKKDYKELDFWGCHIDDAVKKLQSCKEQNELTFIEFNGVKLYSDVDDEESAYLKVTGITKAEFDENERKRNEDYRNAEIKHKEAIPKLTKKWIKEGEKILNPKYIEMWNKCVPIRLNDLYKGMELKMCLDIVKELNNGCSLEYAKEIIECQGHSGMSFGLICSMIRAFCDRGNEFVEFAK